MRKSHLTRAALLALICWVVIPAWAFDPAKDTLSDGLAFNVGIAPLKGTPQDELRIWFLPANGTGFAGYVVRSDGLMRCRSLTTHRLSTPQPLQLPRAVQDHQ